MCSFKILEVATVHVCWCGVFVRFVCVTVCMDVVVGRVCFVSVSVCSCLCFA